MATMPFIHAGLSALPPSAAAIGGDGATLLLLLVAAAAAALVLLDAYKTTQGASGWQCAMDDAVITEYLVNIFTTECSVPKYKAQTQPDSYTRGS